MNLNEYQTKAMSFRLETAHGPYSLLGLVGEVGELMGILAKAHRDGGDPMEINKNVGKELGDILWMVAAVAADFGYSLEDIGQTNIDKLQSRMDRGKLQGSGDDR